MYLWGNGRYGQLAGVGTNLMIPTLAPSLLQTQQVDPKRPPRTSSLLGVCFLLIYLLSLLSLCVLFWVFFGVFGPGCVRTELLLPAAVQWHGSGCGRGPVRQAGPGEF